MNTQTLAAAKLWAVTALGEATTGKPVGRVAVWGPTAKNTKWDHVNISVCVCPSAAKQCVILACSVQYLCHTEEALGTPLPIMYAPWVAQSCTTKQALDTTSAILTVTLLPVAVLPRLSSCVSPVSHGQGP